MSRSLHVRLLRSAAGCGLLLLAALSARAQVAPGPISPMQIQMRIDGVSGPGSISSALGNDAFPLVSLTVPVGRDAANSERPAGAGPPTPEDIQFNMSVSGPAVQLWRLAVEGKVVPKASFAAFDPDGKIRYRIDLEQVVVRSFGLQTMGAPRETVVGTVSYEKIRFTNGAGKDAASASWSRSGK